MPSHPHVMFGVEARQLTRSASRWPARMDWAQSVSGLLLGLFMWGHMAFVSSILLGHDAMWIVTKAFEGYFFFGRSVPVLVSFVVAAVAALIVLHAALALRKFPVSWRQLNTFNEHRRVLDHGHCHQQAFDAMPAVHKVLSMVPGMEIQLVETSCCGMAGSFGYEAEHYDVSMKMAELSLLPAVRNAPQALVVADGTSCRHQIADGTRREAWHVARVLSEALA